MSGPNIDVAYHYYAHTIINDALDADRGIPMPAMASSDLAKPITNASEYETYSHIAAVVNKSYDERAAGFNLIPDGRYFNSRGLLSLDPRLMSRGNPPVEWAAILGPLNNSYPNRDTPWSTGGYLYIWYNERMSARIRQGIFE